MMRRNSASPETPLIDARRNFHLEVAREWYAYDEAVEPFRVARDLALLKSGDPDDAKIWKEYDDATYEIRLKFEKTVATRWRIRNQAVADYRELKRREQ